MKLYCNDEIIGSLTDIEQDAPFFEADVQPVDRASFERLVSANVFLTEIVPQLGCNCFTDPDDDTYQGELTKLCISEQDVDAVSLGRWRIAGTPDMGKVTLVNIRADGRIRWRAM
ncbi:MAG: hypothetical protein ACPG8W_10835 [Candidatus Promineifilaceae bacterium]